jgi:hypothetical protein
MQIYRDAIKKEPDPAEKRKLLGKIHKEIRLGLEGGLWDAEAAAKAKIQEDNLFEGDRIKDTARHFVDVLMKQDLTLAEMQQQVIGIEDREVYEEAWSRLGIRYEAREKNEASAESERFKDAYYQVLSGPGKGYTDIETLRDELEDKDFKPETAEYLLKVAAAREAGVTLPATLATVNDVREKIVTGDIRHASGLFPYLREIGDNFTHLDALITKMNNAEAREIEKASKAFLEMARARLVQTTLFAMDAAGERKYFEFQHWFVTERERRMKLLKEDTHAGRLNVVQEMVNPNNQQTEDGKTYVGGADLDRFTGSLQEDAARAAESLGNFYGNSAAPVIAQDEVGTPVISVLTQDGNEVQVPIPQRMPGESIEEFMARQAINALTPPVPEDSQVEAE